MMKRRPKHELPVVPTANLVDIAILLIIFYMACSNFVSQSAVKLTSPKARDLEKIQEPLVVVTIDREGIIRLQGKEVPNAPGVETGVSVLVKDKKEDQRNVMFRCDAAIGRDVFEPVLQAIVEGGGVVVAAGDNIRTP
jgi:biopolymer transport protein ExbD